MFFMVNKAGHPSIDIVETEPDFRVTVVSHIAFVQNNYDGKSKFFL